MQQPNFVSKKVAPLQYLFQQINANAGLVTTGWGTTVLMSTLMLLFLIFLLIILQIFNASILLEGVFVDWSSLQNYATVPDALSYGEGQFAATGIKIVEGLFLLAAGCVALIAFGFITYPKDKA